MSVPRPAPFPRRVVVALSIVGSLCGCGRWFDRSFGTLAGLQSLESKAVHEELRRLQWIADRNWRADAVPNDRLHSRWKSSRNVDAPTADRATREAPSDWPPPEVDLGSMGEDSVDDLEVLLRNSPEAIREYVDDDGLAGWNAAILLAGTAPSAVDDETRRILRRLVMERPVYEVETGRAPNAWFRGLGLSDERTSEPVRIGESMHLAAAEAWVWSLGAASVSPVDALAPVGRVLEDRELPLHVRAELVRGVARWIDPRRIPHLEAAVGDDARRHAPHEMRRAAMEACVVHAAWNRANERRYDEDRWPVRVHESESDPDAVVRAEYGRWLALLRSPRSIDVLRRQLNDHSPTVRDAAIEALATLSAAPDERDGLGELARSELDRLADESEPRIRALAVRAIGRNGGVGLERFVEDESHHVRGAVAEALSHSPNPKGAGLLLDLVSDRSLQVESSAVRAVEGWPNALAAPVLLRAMEDGAIPTRVAADRALRSRVEGGFVYHEQEPVEARRRALADIARRFDLPTTPPIVESDVAGGVEPYREREILADLRDVSDPKLQGVVLDRLRSVRGAEIALVERQLESLPPNLQARLVSDVLAEASPVYESLLRIERGTRRERLAAARRLARTATETPMSPFAVRRLREIVAADVTDRDVWRAVLEAVGPDGGEEAARIVQLAIGFHWPDVQTLGCEFIENHPRPQYANWLIPLFESRDTAVRIAAIRAAAACANPLIVEGVSSEAGVPPTGLRTLLRDENSTVRLEAAVALSVLGDAGGLREVDRLARSPEPNVRLDAVRAMARSRHVGFVGTLVQMAGDDAGPRVRAEALAALDEIVPSEERPRLPAASRAPDVAARVWADWFERRRRTNLRSAA